jgi:hypothetical protein
MSQWWDATPDPRLSQGDIVNHVPVAVVLHPLTQLSQNKGDTVWRDSAMWTPNKEGVGNLLSRGRVMPVLVLSHECEIDKNESKGRVVVAPIAPLTNLREDEQENVLAQRRFSKMPLPEVPTLGSCYADLRLTAAVDRQYLDVARRIASLSDAAVGRLRLQLIAFFTRLDASPDVERLSKRAK